MVATAPLFHHLLGQPPSRHASPTPATPSWTTARARRTTDNNNSIALGCPQIWGGGWKVDGGTAVYRSIHLPVSPLGNAWRPLSEGVRRTTYNRSDARVLCCTDNDDHRRGVTVQRIRDSMDPATAEQEDISS